MSFKETFLLNVGGDIEFDGINRLKMISGSDKVVQDLKILFGTQRESNLLHPEFGLDHLTMVSRPTDQVIKQQIIKALQDYQFLSDITDIDIVFDKSNRYATVAVAMEIEGNPEIFSLRIRF